MLVTFVIKLHAYKIFKSNFYPSALTTTYKCYIYMCTLVKLVQSCHITRSSTKMMSVHCPEAATEATITSHNNPNKFKLMNELD